MNKLLAALVFLAMFIVSRPAGARELNVGALDPKRPNQLHFSTGAEYAFVGGFGYTRTLWTKAHPISLTGDVLLPYARPDFGDYRARVTVQTPIVARRGWTLGGRVSPVMRGARSELARMTSVGADVGLVGGYYAPRWFLAGEFGFDWAMATHLRHRKTYRETVYEDARDGWYASTAVNFYYGLVGGYSFRPVDLVLRVGQSRNVFDGQTAMLPLYATFGVNVRFGDVGCKRQSCG